MFPNHTLSAILLTPLAGALVLLAMNGRRTQAIRWVASAFAGLAFAAALPLWFRYDPHGKTWQFAERGEWIPAIGASYYVGADGFSILLILLTTLIVWIAIVASWTEIRERVKAFHVCMLVLQAGLLGAFMALDFLLFFGFWNAILACMFFLIRLWGGAGRLRSARTFLLFTAAGSVAMLAGILRLYFHHHAAAGVYSFDITQYHVGSLPFGIQQWVFVAWFLAFAVIVPLIPLQAWLPGAHAAAPTAASVVLAAVLLKIGTYGFIRFSLPILPDASRYVMPVMAALSIAGIVVGALAALVQSDWKRLIAYASVSQMSLIVLGTFALTPDAVTGSIVQQINHGISIGALSLALGMASQRTQTTDISEYGGLFKVMPVLALIFLIMTMSAIGLPALNGFVGAALILKGVSVVSRWWTSAAAAGMALSAVYMIWVCRQTLFGQVKTPGNAPLRDLTAREVAIFAPLVVLAIWIGVYPAPFLRRLETSAGRVVARANPVYAPVVAQGSDCPTAAPPDPAGPPPVFVLAEPCADGSDPGKKPEPDAGKR